MLAFTGNIDTNYWGYRLLPGTLIFFLAGAAMATPARFDSRFVPAVFGLSLVGFAMTLVFPSLYELSFDFEVSLGAVIGIAAVYLLKRFPATPLDKLAGDLSYGVFLSHFPMIFLADAFDIGSWPFVPFAAIVSAVVSYSLVERPALELRHRLRSGKPLPRFVWRKNDLGIAADRSKHG